MANLPIGCMGAGGLVGCGSVQKLAARYTAFSTVATVVGTAQNALTGKFGWQDALTFLPALSFGVSKFLGLGGCFEAGTEVVTGSDPSRAGAFSTKPIEAVRVGDFVLSRDEHDPAAPAEFRRVTEVFRRTATVIDEVTICGADGSLETIAATPEHPFYVDGQGWTAAGDLHTGQRLLLPDGGTAEVTFVAERAAPDGVAVYNFTVEGDHTYFVSAAGQADVAVWVHNTYVYWATKGGKPTYVGITEDMASRARDHLRKVGRAVSPIPGISAKTTSRKLARANEHELITTYGRIQDRFGKPLGGILENVNRGIDPRKLGAYVAELKEAKRIVAKLGL